MQNEKELIQSCLRGNREAFGPLVKKYQTQVLRRVRAIVNRESLRVRHVPRYYHPSSYRAGFGCFVEGWDG